MTLSRTRIGKACTERMPAASARGAKAGQRDGSWARSTSMTASPVR